MTTSTAITETLRPGQAGPVTLTIAIDGPLGPRPLAPDTALPTHNGRVLRAKVVDENAVRAAAGITLVIGAVAFCLALFEARYLPLQVASAVFFVEFLVRTTAGFRYAPVGVVAHWMTRRLPPDWVSAKPKLFAWKLGLTLSFFMTVITNSGIRGLLPRTLCVICMALMWMESSLGLCLGCESTAGWSGADGWPTIPASRCARTACATFRPTPDTAAAVP